MFLIRSAFQATQAAGFPALIRRPETVLRADAMLRRFQLDNARVLVAVAPAARWRSKTWPPEFFAEVLERVAVMLPEARFWLLGTADERTAGEKLLACCRRAQPANLMGETSLSDLVEMLRRSAVLLTNDSGPMHLAAAVARPTVALFSATDPRLTGPYGETHVIFRGECPQAPCFRELCPRPESPCLHTITPEAVAAAVAQSAAKSGVYPR